MPGWDDISAPVDDWDSVSAPAKAAPKPKSRPKRSATENVSGFMANVNRGLGIGDEMAAGAQTAVNLFSGRTPITEIGADFNRSMAKQRRVEDQFAAEKPKTAALARGTGTAATVALPTGGAANLFAQGSRLTNAARGATLAGTQGAAFAAADRGTARERLKAASETARNPVVLGFGALSGAVATPRRAPKPRRIDPGVELLSREGVQLTPGQMRGGVAKTAEDAATSTPILGDKIIERRTEGVQTFNKAVINRALKPIGEKLPDDLPAGTEAVKYAGDLLSRGYDDAIPGRIVRADPGFADDVRSALSNIDTMTPDARARLADILDQRVTSRLPQNGAMDGRLYKIIQSDLDYEASRFMKSTDADQRAIGDAISGVQRAIESAAKRQDPAFAAKITALDRGWAELARLESAAAKSRDLSGVFTPSQYAQSIRAGDVRVRKRGVARGEALSQDLAKAATKVLPSGIPDSGTAGRAAWGMVTAAPGAALGAITGGGPGAIAGIAGTAATLSAASKIYSPQAVQAANAALTARVGSQAQQDAMAALAEMAARDPSAQRLYQQVAARLSRAAGVAGGSQAAPQPRNLFVQP